MGDMTCFENKIIFNPTFCTLIQMFLFICFLFGFTVFTPSIKNYKKKRERKKKRKLFSKAEGHKISFLLPQYIKEIHYAHFTDEKTEVYGRWTNKVNS